MLWDARNLGGGRGEGGGVRAIEDWVSDGLITTVSTCVASGGCYGGARNLGGGRGEGGVIALEYWVLDGLITTVSTCVGRGGCYGVLEILKTGFLRGLLL